MKRKNGIFGLSLIAAALACQAAPAKNAIAKSEGEPPDLGGSDGNTTISVLELDQLRADARRNKALENKTNSLGNTLLSLFPEEAGKDADVFSLAGSLASRLHAQTLKVQAVADVIEKHFPDRIKEGETALSLAEKLIREHAEKVAGKSASNAIVEGSSAKIVDENGKGNAEVYVLGVNKEKGEAAIYGTPPKIVSLKALAPLKRGYAIAGHEVALREKTWPGKTWDVRED